MEEGKPKIELSAEEFIKAMKNGEAKDGNGNKYTFKSNGKDHFFISNISVTDILWIEKIEFNNRVIFCNCEFLDFAMFRCKFQNGFAIDNVLVHSAFVISSTEIQEDLSITRSTFDEVVTLTHLTIQKKLQVRNSKFHNNASVFNTMINGELIVLNSTFKNELKIDQGGIDVIYLSDLPEKCTLNIFDISFRKIETDHGFVNLGYMQWNNLKPMKNSVIEITNAMMGKWDIVNCDFSKTKMIIYSSKITDAFYTNTNFPEKLSLPGYISVKETAHDILRDGYNQLKTIAQKQNDRRTFLHYQAAELSSYYKTLHWCDNFRTKFQLGAMALSNFYGTSWVRGFWFVVIVNLLFVIVCFRYRSYQFDCTGLGNFFGLFLSSLSSLISLPKGISQTSNWEMNWFYISRIPLAFGIYQIIAAFRKFGKSE